MSELRILTPTGMLGYGLPAEHLAAGMERGVDAIIVDSGSTDPGAYLLAEGRTLVGREAYRRDLALLVDAVIDHRVPLLIGSAAGPGLNGGVALFLDLVREHAQNRGASLSVATIGAEIAPERVMAGLAAGRLAPCGSAPTIADGEVAACSNIVAQLGAEPFAAALEHEPDIVIAGRAYDPAPYAAYLARAMPALDPGLAWHLGKVLECGALAAEPKGHAMLATLRESSFDLEPLDPAARCTPVSVAAHAFYEKSRPDLLAGPGGTLDLTETRYEALDERRVRVTGSRFVPTPYTVKVEGAGTVGHRATFTAGIRDPILIPILPMVRQLLTAHVGKMHPAVAAGEASVTFHLYGLDGVMGEREPVHATPHEVGLFCEAVAPTPEEALDIAATARVAALHAPYPGQLATGGNIAMPTSPPEVAAGPVCLFHLYHLLAIDDPLEPFPIEIHHV